jgi:SAM-dependent methyltransferase
MALERLDPGAADDSWILHGFEHLQRYDFALQRVRGCAGRGLDLGCGIGYGSFVLANCSRLEVTGIDISPDTINMAKKKYSHPRLEYRALDALDLPFESESFDVAVSFENIEHVADRRRYLEGCARVLKKGGQLILSAPNADFFRRTGTLNPFHLSEPTYDELKVDLQTLFRVEEEHEQSTVVKMGRDSWLQLFEARKVILVRLENRLRTLIGVPLVPPARNDRLFGDMKIIPLLPERRKICQQFLFVCSKV